MKLTRTALIILGIVLIIGVLASSALAASTTKALSTNFTLVNLGTLPADVIVDYLLSSGEPWPNVNPANKSFSLGADGGQIQIRQYADTMSPGAGSAVVSSSQPLGAIVQIQARNQVATTGAYKGDSQGSGVFYIPLLARRGVSASGTANSQIIIQNAGIDAVNFDVVLKPAPGFTGTYTKSVTNLAKGISYYYDLESETNLPENWFGSAVVTATSLNGTLSVVANVFFGADGMQTYNAFSQESLGNKWLIPIFTSRLTNGLSTVVTVQNLTGGTLATSAVALNCLQDGTLTPQNFSNPVQIDRKSVV